MKKILEGVLKQTIRTENIVHFSILEEFSVGHIQYVVLNIHDKGLVLSRRPESTERWKDFQYSTTIKFAEDAEAYLILLDDLSIWESFCNRTKFII